MSSQARQVTSAELEQNDGARAETISYALVHFRPKLDRSLPLVERAENFWAIAVTVRDLAAADVLAAELMRFARESGFMRDLGWHGSDDIQHLIRWAMLDRCPFVTFGATSHA
jgi:hypothetical protein